MNRREIIKGMPALPLLALPGWSPAKHMPSVYADGKYFPVLQANKDKLLIVLAEPLRGYRVFKADRPWDDKLDKVNLIPLGEP